MYTDEEYEMLEDALKRAYQVCPPDEYQLRLNDLCRTIGKFLMIPYQLKQSEEFLDKEKKKVEWREKQS